MTSSQWRKYYWSGRMRPRWNLFDCKMYAGEGSFGRQRACFHYTEM